MALELFLAEPFLHKTLQDFIYHIMSKHC